MLNVLFCHRVIYRVICNTMVSHGVKDKNTYYINNRYFYFIIFITDWYIGDLTNQTFQRLDKMSLA